MQSIGDGFLATKQVATYTGLSTSFFEKGRVYGYGPPYHRVRGRVLYRKSDVERWLADQRRESNGRADG